MISTASSVDPAVLDLAQALGDLRLRDAEHPQRVAVQRRRPRQHGLHRRGRERRRPHRLQLARRPGQDDHHRLVRPGRPGPARSRPGRARSPPPGPSPACGWPRRTASVSKLKPARARSGAGSRRSSPPSPRRGPARGPAKRPTTSAVRSSAVGPSPPLVTIRSIPSAARKRSAASRSSGRSATTTMWATSTPSSASRSDSQGPLRSEIRPVRTSVPVTTMPARATHVAQVRPFDLRRGFAERWPPRSIS